MTDSTDRTDRTGGPDGPDGPDGADRTSYPLRVRGQITEPLSRWLWLVKWLLVIPHLIVLIFLWTAYLVVTVIAFFAILITGRYPPALFGFNRGVLRWSWRVGFYSYSALGTDRYPPFTLAAVPDYPATLELDYPAQLSRGLVLVKWWLLALPHYLILAAFGGTAVLSWDDTDHALGVLAVVVLIVGVALLFTGRYPRGLFDLAMGVNRWSLRVTAYASLMTDVYPPFRLDQGGQERGTSAPSDPKPSAATALTPGGSSAGRIVALMAGVLLSLLGLALAAAGGAGLWLNSQRDGAGFLSTPTRSISSSAAAVTIEDVDLDIDRSTRFFLSSEDLGQVRVRVTTDAAAPVFVGIAPQADVDRWLAGRAHDEITGIDNSDLRYQRRSGGSGVSPPSEQRFWSVSASGTGTQELQWRVTSGTWSIVTARPDGATGLNVQASVAAKIPSLATIATGLLLGGLVLFLIGAALIAWGAIGLGRHPNRVGPQPTPSSIPPSTGS